MFSLVKMAGEVGVPRTGMLQPTDSAFEAEELWVAQEVAATRIQSFFRGHNARRRARKSTTTTRRLDQLHNEHHDKLEKRRVDALMAQKAREAAEKQK